MQTIFYTGGYFRDRKQGYTVLAVTDKAVKIQYDDGTEDTLDEKVAEIKSRIFLNVLSDYSRVHPVNTEGYYKTLGYLSKHGHFKAEIIKSTYDKFIKNYEEITSVKTDWTNPNIRLINNQDTWGAALRIFLPLTAKDLEFAPSDKIALVMRDNATVINNNPYWTRLIGIGFRLGTDHDIDQIRNSITSVDDKNAFQQGLLL